MAQGVWRQYFGIAGGPSGTGCLAEWVCSERTATQFAVNMPPSSRLSGVATLHVFRSWLARIGVD